MKKSCLLLFIILMSGYCQAMKKDTTQVFFFEDTTVMNDFSRESIVVSNMMKALKEFNKNDMKVIREDGKQRGIPLREAQLLKLLRCMNVAANSKGKLLVVFVNRDNGKLLNVNIANLKFENPIYQIVSAEQFNFLLKEDKVDFKLRMVDGKFKSPARDNQFMTDFYLNNKNDYVYAVDMVSGKYPILFEELNLEMNVFFETFPDSVKKDNRKAEIKSISITPDCTLLGCYISEDMKTYSKGDNVIGETSGIYEMPVELEGNAITLKYLVRTMTIINVNSGSGQIFAEGYKLLL